MTPASSALLCSLLTFSALSAQSAPAPKPKSAPLTFTIVDRQRIDTTQWFSATPDSELYGHVDTLLRLGLQQRIRHIDWQLELSQNAELFLPNDAVSPVAAQGQLGLGGTYFAANSGNRFPVAASFKTGFLRYHFKRDADTLRIGRFEFADGAETTPRDSTLLWLQSNRMNHRMIGNFGFSNAQRSFDGVEAKVGGPAWDLTALAARADQGVFNMNANPELNVDLQYLAYTRSAAHNHLLLRGFAMGYHDGRTGLTKTDNRPLAVRQTDHKNIRIGSYGGSAIAAIPAGKNTIDVLFWGVLQNGTWGLQDHRAGGVAVEAGLLLNSLQTRPWLRGGFLRTTGDNTPNDGTHNTFFQVLPTPRFYARFPVYNLMNSSDQFVQLVDKPTSKLDLRTDLHFLQLTSPSDLWYQGGGAYDNKVFGYVGRPSNGHSSFTSLYDISADYAITPRLSVTGYYARFFGKSVVAAIYPREHDAQFGFFELNYKLSHPIGGSSAR